MGITRLRSTHSSTRLGRRLSQLTIYLFRRYKVPAWYLRRERLRLMEIKGAQAALMSMSTTGRLSLEQSPSDDCISPQSRISCTSDRLCRASQAPQSLDERSLDQLLRTPRDQPEADVLQSHRDRLEAKLPNWLDFLDACPHGHPSRWNQPVKPSFLCLAATRTFEGNHDR